MSNEMTLKIGLKNKHEENSIRDFSSQEKPKNRTFAQKYDFLYTYRFRHNKYRFYILMKGA